MNHYNHLTLIEREKILFYHAQGKNLTFISKQLGRHKSTISREIRRNSNNDEYMPAIAQNNYQKRRKSCHRKRLLSNPDLFCLVKSKFLDHQWSPEQIQNRLKYEKSTYSISYNAIYRAIYRGDFNEKGLSHGNRGAIRKLRHRGKSRHTKNYVERRGKIPISHMISERPIEAENRSRIGDWEADTVAGVTGKKCFVTLVDRKSRFLICDRIDKKTSENVKQSIVKILKDEPVTTITPDRGKEFGKHSEITAELEIEFYFPLPHHPWQRGTNENTNGLLREYFPKNTDISDLADEYIQNKVSEINMRPRKCLGWKTPYEVYYSQSLHLI